MPKRNVHIVDFKAWRKRHGLTQEQAASVLGITRQAYATSEAEGKASTERRLAMIGFTLLSEKGALTTHGQGDIHKPHHADY